MRFDKLNIGCGARIEEGWINIDLEFFGGITDRSILGGDVMGHDVRKGLPFPEGSIAMIFTEHFIEHLTRDEGQAFLRECYRVLVPGGALRIATPNLYDLVTLYNKGESEGVLWQDRYRAVGYVPASLARMMNEGMRDWGHLFIYDEDELADGLRDAGFVVQKSANVVRHGKTSTPGMLTEGRPYTGDLVVEVCK